MAVLAGHAAAGAITGLDPHGHLRPVAASTSTPFSYSRLESGVQIHVGAVTKNIIFYGSKTVRVNTNLGANYWNYPSLVVTDKPDAIAFETRDTPDTLTLESPALRVVITKSTGAVTFMDTNGKVYTQEKADAPQTLKKIEISGAPTYEAANTFLLKARRTMV